MANRERPDPELQRLREELARAFEGSVEGAEVDWEPRSQPNTESSNRRSKLPRTVMDTYSDVFEISPRLSTLKYAANLGVTDVMFRMLQEAVDTNTPVSDWDAFAEKLYEVSRERIAAEK